MRAFPFPSFQNPSRPAAGRGGRQAGSSALAVVAAVARACLEPLEGRQLFSVTTSLVDGTLFVQGNDQFDKITIDHSGQSTFVNGVAVSDSLITKKIVIGTGGSPSLSDKQVVNVMANVRPVEIFGQGGDIITPAPDLVVNIGKNGSARGVQREVNIHGIGLFNEVLVDDSKDTVARHGTTNTVNRVTTVTGVAPATIRFDSEGTHNLNVKLGVGNDTFDVLDTFYHFQNVLVGRDGADTVIDTGAGSDTVRVFQTTAEGRLHIEGNSGIDTVEVGDHGLTGRLEESLTVTNAGGFTNLTIDDSASFAPRDVTMTRVPNDFHTFEVFGFGDNTSVFFAENDVNVLFLKGGKGGNTFTVEDTFKAASPTSGSQTIINSGTGADKVNVKRTTGGLSVAGQSGLDLINVTNNGSAQGIKAPLFVNNQFGLTTLLVNDTASTAPRNVVLDADVNPADHSTATGRVNGLAPAQISYRLNDVQTLSLSTGSGNDSFAVHATQVRTELLLNGGKGGDQFFLGSQGDTMDTIQRKVTVNGQDGSDLLWIFDKKATGVHTYTTFADHFERSGSAPVAFVGIEGLEVQKGKVLGSPPLAKNLTAPASVKVGQYATIAGSLVDADLSDKLTLTVDWGDGGKPTVAMPGRDPFAVKHKYLVAGSYTVRVIWTDSGKQSNFRDLRLVVKPA